MYIVFGRARCIERIFRNIQAGHQFIKSDTSVPQCFISLPTHLSYSKSTLILPIPFPSAFFPVPELGGYSFPSRSTFGPHCHVISFSPILYICLFVNYSQCNDHHQESDPWLPERVVHNHTMTLSLQDWLVKEKQRGVVREDEPHNEQVALRHILFPGIELWDWVEVVGLCSETR